MKKKIIYGSILAAFLMISLAFIQPVSAYEKQSVEIIQTTEIDIQEVESLAEMISSDKQVLSLVEPLLQDRQISCILEQMQVATGPDEMYILLTELETLLMSMDLDPEIGNLLMERYGTEMELIINCIDWDTLMWLFALISALLGLLKVLGWLLDLLKNIWPTT